MKRTSIAILIAGLSISLVAGCSSSAEHKGSSPAQHTSAKSPRASGAKATASTPPGCVADYVAQVCATVKLSGEQNVSFKASDTAPTGPDVNPSEKCVDFVKGVDRDLPLDVDLHGPDGSEVQSNLHIGRYHGPGTYRLDATHQSDGIQFQLQVADADGGNGGYIEVNDTTTVTGAAAVTVGPDFSVTVSFTGLPSPDDLSKKVSGSIQWTCVDPK